MSSYVLPLNIFFRIVEFGHPSRLEAVLVYMGVKQVFNNECRYLWYNLLFQFKLSLTHSLGAAIRRSIPTGTYISDDSVMKISFGDLEKLIREVRHTKAFSQTWKTKCSRIAILPTAHQLTPCSMYSLSCGQSERFVNMIFAQTKKLQ